MVQDGALYMFNCDAAESLGAYDGGAKLAKLLADAEATWVAVPQPTAGPTPVPSPVPTAVPPTPATHAILTRLKAGDTVHQAGELPKTH